MGTSSMFKGQKDNRLLPEDYDENDNSSENPNLIQNNNNEWKYSKNAVSKYLNSDKSNPSKSFYRYTKASGGSEKMSKSSTTGIKGVSSLGGFLNSVKTEGIQKTFEKYNIDYIGKSAKNVLAILSDKLCEVDDTKEEAIGKSAMCKTLQELYEMIENGNNDELSSLELLDDAKFNIIINKYIENYIFIKFMKDFQYRFEASKISNQDIIVKESEVKTFIKNSISRVTTNIDLSKFDFKNSETIRTIYEKCYKVWED